MEFDHRKLRGRIIEKFETCEAFAAAAGYSKASLSARLNNAVHFDSEEIVQLCTPELLDIAAEEIPVYFFVPKFDK